MLLAIPLVIAASALAQEVGEHLCGDCHTTGRIDHTHSTEALAQEKGVLFCSAFMRSDREALGMDWVVCPRCRTPSVQAGAKVEFDAEFGRRKQWLAEREAEVDAPVGHTVEHIQTEHFVIAWDIPKFKIGRASLRPHDAMHVYVERMEELYRLILEIHGITERQVQRNVHYLYIFESQKDAQRVGDHLFGGIGPATRKSVIGNKSRFICFWKKDDFKKDEDFHQFLVHTVSHHIHNDVDRRKEWLMKRYGWVYEGLAHYLEIRGFGPPITWCGQESGSFLHWKGKNWEVNVKRAVMEGGAPLFQEVITKAADSLSAMEHQFVWSYIDYLMWLDPKKMPPLLGLMKGPQLPTRDALKQAYDLSIGEFVEGWEEFVRTEYSLKPRAGPFVRPPKGG